MSGEGDELTLDVLLEGTRQSRLKDQDLLVPDDVDEERKSEQVLLGNSAILLLHERVRCLKKVGGRRRNQDGCHRLTRYRELRARGGGRRPSNRKST